jgi:hypothetical protein
VSRRSPKGEGGSAGVLADAYIRFQMPGFGDQVDWPSPLFPPMTPRMILGRFIEIEIEVFKLDPDADPDTENCLRFTRNVR